ncbi:C40 family peptidase [Actinospica durhamensis]|uniref:C40 family peptidase n=1 Tax=Actinospica durhamensis TaxID=1508375 RepID=A0A941INE1_9ACTN|nr:C40 family peptidase [Actinospica durhamensis]MBR7835305.1 C40 family peptidase [Actinospica durhamensis]
MITAGAGVAGSSEASAGVRAHHHHARTARHHHHHHEAMVERRPARRPTIVLQPPPSSTSTRGRIALDFAIRQIGKPYVYGGAGPDSYDCSGLTQRAWRAAGVRIPRTTWEQARFGAPVSLDRIQPGDLVIFYADASHVGLYAGDGKVVVAPHQGTYVTVQLMKWMPVHTVRRPG